MHDTIGQYRIIEKLGEGGMGVVYRAYDDKLRREVAIKLLPQGVVGDDARKARVLAEARAAAALNHPGVATVFDVREEECGAFIVMEYVAGRTLRELIRDKEIDGRRMCRLAAQVADALEAAHQRGIVHCDIKPENIIVQPDERVKLLDFGIASTNAATLATVTVRTGEIVQPLPAEISGTLPYMAPEQWKGDAVDARTDLYSLGVCMYEAIAGRRPFPGPTASALAAQVLDEVPPPIDGASIPSDLRRMILRLLEKSPDDRYRSAHELERDLVDLSRRMESGAAAESCGRTVAVLPFRLLAPNAEDDYLRVALADSILNQLSGIAGLVVRPTSAVLRFQTESVDPMAAARELNASIVVDGSILKIGQKLRVHAQARSSPDGAVIVSLKQDAELLDLFGLQDRISDALAKSLGASAPECACNPATANKQAYELYLRASEKLLRMSRWDVRMAVEMLEEAVRLDPGFGDAWARLGEAQVWMGVTFEPGTRWLRLAEKSIQRALGMDPANANAQCARAHMLWTAAKGFQNAEALHALNRALERRPGDFSAAVQRIVILGHVGVFEEATAEGRAMLASHPDSVRVLDTLGQTALWSGDYDGAEHFFARARSVDPSSFYIVLDFPTPPLYSGNLDLAAERIRLGLEVLPGEPMLLALDGMVWAKRGEPERARKMLARALKSKKCLLHAHHVWHHAAAAYAVLGESAQAIELLNRASAFGLPCYPLFRGEPHFKSLHGLPEFDALMVRLERECNTYRERFGARA